MRSSDVGVVVLRGAGEKAFCAGGDVVGRFANAVVRSVRSTDLSLLCCLIVSHRHLSCRQGRKGEQDKVSERLLSRGIPLRLHHRVVEQTARRHHRWHYKFALTDRVLCVSLVFNVASFLVLRFFCSLQWAAVWAFPFTARFELRPSDRCSQCPRPVRCLCLSFESRRRRTVKRYAFFARARSCADVRFVKGIGLFPDVGGSYFLPRLPLKHYGRHIALTGMLSRPACALDESR